LVAVPLAGAGSRAPAAVRSSLTVIASPRAARAHDVRLTLTFRYEMQCGYPGAGSLIVTFPPALKLPKRLAPGAVRLRKKPIAARVDGRTITMLVPPHERPLCNVIGPGSLALVFTRAAELANPGRAGSYRFTATHATRRFSAKLAITPAS
jgi:hypothetical protein